MVLLQRYYREIDVLIISDVLLLSPVTGKPLITVCTDVNVMCKHLNYYLNFIVYCFMNIRSVMNENYFLFYNSISL